MDFIIVGAGAVGAVLGTLLANDGHQVRFWVRPAQRERLKALSIERVGGTAQRIDSPQLLCPGDHVAASEWVLVCVRGEQLTQALREVVEHMGLARRVAIAAVSLQAVGQRAHEVGLTGRAFALHAAFGSHAEPGAPYHFKWFPFTPPTTVTPDGERSWMPQAKELARALRRAGLPATTSLSMNAYMRFMTAVLTPLALSWDICGWQLRALARDAPLRLETACAIRESVGLVVPPRSALRLLPVWFYEAFVRVLALFMGREAREVWLYHGPKIRDQTDAFVRELLQLAQREAPRPAALSRLFERWQQFLNHAPSDPVRAISASSARESESASTP